MPGQTAIRPVRWADSGRTNAVRSLPLLNARPHPPIGETAAHGAPARLSRWRREPSREKDKCHASIHPLDGSLASGHRQ
jgi:hypothetical protein